VDGGLITGLSLATVHWLLITDHFPQRGAIMPTKKKHPGPERKQEKTKPEAKAKKAARGKKTAVVKKSPNKKDFPIVGIGSSSTRWRGFSGRCRPMPGWPLWS
jgi:hypothetical protein